MINEPDEGAAAAAEAPHNPADGPRVRQTEVILARYSLIFIHFRTAE